MSETSQNDHAIRTGDTVFHVPSGETWAVAWADHKEVICCGWPETIAPVSDCALVNKCSDAEHLQMLRVVAADTIGVRGRRCWYELERIKESECAKVMHV